VQTVTVMKTQGTKMRDAPTTIGMANLRRIFYAARSTPFQWQTNLPLYLNRVIRGSTVE